MGQGEEAREARGGKRKAESGKRKAGVIRAGCQRGNRTTPIAERSPDDPSRDHGVRNGAPQPRSTPMVAIDRGPIGTTTSPEATASSARGSSSVDSTRAPRIVRPGTRTRALVAASL